MHFRYLVKVILFIIDNMVKSIRSFLLLVCIMLAAHLHAAHILGGIAEYEFVSQTTSSTVLKVRFKLFRDAQSGGATFDAGTTFGVYQQLQDGSYHVYDVITDQSVDFIQSYTTNIGGEQFVIESGAYEFNVTLAKGNDYLIAYQRCCRNQQLLNLFDPGETGIAIQIEIFAGALTTNLDSPYLATLPFSGAAAGSTFSNQLDVVKENATQINFEFTNAKKSGGIFDAATGNTGCCDCVRPNASNCLPPYDDVVFKPPFTPSNPFNSVPKIELDPDTGELSGNLQLTGKYNYGIAITNSFNNTMLSRQILDYSFAIAATVSVLDEELSKAISVYPNPTTGDIYLQTNDILLPQIESIYLIDTQGRIIEVLDNQIDKWLITSPKGVYYLVFETLDGRVITRVVKL